MVPYFTAVSDPKDGIGLMATPVVNRENCIGCGLCVELCPNVFELKEDKAWVKDVGACSSCDCPQTADSCPVQAITLE